jgi:hypothetical protein
MTATSAIHLDNVSLELATQVAWTKELVDVSYGDIWINDLGFGTFVWIKYPSSEEAAQLLINALSAEFLPVLSMAFDYDSGRSPALRALSNAESPWSEDGVMIGYMPESHEISYYSHAAQIERVAEQFIEIEAGIWHVT